MIIEHYSKGDTIFRLGETKHALSLIAEGSVVLSISGISHKASTGFILGCASEYDVVYPYTVQAVEDVTLHTYEYNSYSVLKDLVNQNKSGAYVLTSYSVQNICVLLGAYAGLMKKCALLFDNAKTMYENYISLCMNYGIAPTELAGIAELGTFRTEASVPPAILDYYAGAGTIDSAGWKAHIGSNAELAAGSIYKIHQDMLIVSAKISALTRYQNMIIDLYITDYNIDLFTFELSLLEKVLDKGHQGVDVRFSIDELKKFIEENVPADKALIAGRSAEYETLIETLKTSGTGPADSIDMLASDGLVDDSPEGSSASGSGDFPNELINSLQTILNYAGLSESDIKMFEDILKRYAATLNSNSTQDESSRKLRQEVTQYFYKLYEVVFFKTLKEPEMPAPVKMFMYFGYLDENMAGKDNAYILYRMSRKLAPDPNQRVYAFYDWLKAIYACKKDPSVNEFNMDYTALLHKKRVEGSITEAQEREELRDGVKRVKFEIANMFRSTNKTMSSHVTTFCPVFTEGEVYKPIEKALLSYKDTAGVLDLIRKIDFSLFYRETTFSDPSIGVTKEIVQKEVVPDIILMPTIGSRGTMWQEITGRVRTTPGRFILPILLMDDLPKIMIHMCGEFRWELCRRIQGARWNDISERSLTSDYCEYIETFRKNKDLSPEQKEKIKATYQKCRNSTKEMFSRDYVDFIFYEANGALRLNKVARNILFTYCPLSKDIRLSLEQNAIYRELLERFKNKRHHALHLSDLSMQRIEKAGHTIPAEIKEHRYFLTL